MAASIGDKIILNFSWKGPTKWQGVSNIEAINLLFKGSQTQIRINLPEMLSPPSTTFQKFPFSCREYVRTDVESDGTKVIYLSEPRQHDLLKVTVEQIRDLTLTATIFEESSSKRSAIMDSSGGIIPEKSVIRSEKEVKLEVPELVESGQIYSLRVTTDDTSISASLQKNEARIKGVLPSTKKEEVPLSFDQEKLFNFLDSMSLPFLLSMKMDEFVRVLDDKISILTNYKAQYFEIKTLIDTIKKIETDLLSGLMLKINALNLSEKKSLKEYTALKHEAFDAYLAIVGPTGLENMMRAALEALIRGKVSPFAELHLQDFAERFREVCMKISK